MQGLCQLEVQGSEKLDDLNRFFVENENDESVCKLALEWTKGTWTNIEQIDEQIGGSIIRWGLKRLCFVDKGILRLSVYQLQYCPDIPPKVVINEAIELARKFSTEKSPGFVNGVLDAILKKSVKS